MALFSDEQFGDEVLASYMAGASVAVACMALEALSRRPGPGDHLIAPILGALMRVHYWTAYFALRVLARRIEQPVIGAVLARIDDEWPTPLSLAMLREFIALRLASGETPTLAGELDQLNDYRAATLTTLTAQLGDMLPESLQTEVTTWRGSRVDTELLRGIGRVWDRADIDPTTILPSARIDEVLAQIETALRSNPPRPVALVGESGVGKTAALRALAERLQRDGWTIFEAGASDLLAGQVFMGQLEGRMQALLRSIEHRKVLWIVPHFQELLWAGRSQQSPTGALDHLVASLESGAVHLVGELTPAAYERLLQAKPQLRSLLATARLRPSADDETLDLAHAWIAARGDADAAPLMEAEALHEAAHLVNQYLGDRAAPGNLLHFLGATYRRLAATGPPPAAITLDDLLVTLSQLSGLPLRILDERETVDLHDLRAHFNRRVIGQPEAIDCLVERIAMIKAGVNDPDRPIGVFLFVGPTGTGKTEIAKTFAQYLFGSAHRMIRLDMSELQTPESLDRVLGNVYESAESTALVNAIRRQPFSVLLLDEFEKAHPNIWDVFLQVFDDGRLTDRRGDVADFRHAVIIMTSNLGARLPYGATIGFVAGDTRFTPRSVERAVAETFRREFINRIDRIVVFRPLGRAEMREILHKELDDVLQRRGFRGRNWAVEWDVSAIDFLLEKGFTPDLGARPLRRAVERYVLAPLATAIVNREVPEGDQFLFVRADGDKLDAVFIDPDAPEDEPADEREMAGLRPTPDQRALVVDPAGTREEIDFLEDRFDGLARVIGGADWQETKAGALAQLRTEGFWDSPDRFSVLGLAEFMDRLEVGLDTAGSLLRRLRGQGGGERQHYSRDLVQRVAQQLYLVETAHDGLAAGTPRDAYVMINSVRDTAADRKLADEFARRVANMYREWARRRRMRLEVLEETSPGEPAPFRAVFAISGFGAYSILAPESGMHVLETPQDDKSFDRVKTRVVVAPQSDAPSDGPKQERAQAVRLLDTAADATAQTIVRRYREEPSPLVRDSVRGWRTGRIDRVFGGDFDVLA